MEDRFLALESELDKLNRKLLQLSWKIEDIDKNNLEEPSVTAEEPSVTAEEPIATAEEALEIIEEPSDAVEVEIFDLREKLVSVESELSEIRIRIGVLNKLISSYEIPDINLPDTNIISHSLWKRMWAVFGHGLVGNVILTMWIFTIIIMLFRGT
jgi:chromosome segregation ATPase